MDLKKQIYNSLNKGFTLIELLVVISVIGVLASVILVSLSSARSKARYSAVSGTMRQIQTAAELYFNEYQSYPLGNGPVSWNLANNTFPANFGNYLTIPTPPCPNWQYLIAQFPPSNATAIVIRKVVLGVIITPRKTYKCLSGPCSLAPALSPLVEIQDWDPKSITCEE